MEADGDLNAAPAIPAAPTIEEQNKQLAAAGEVLFKEPLTDWTRKLQVTLLVLTGLTGAIALGAIRISEFSVLTFKGAPGTQEGAARAAAVATLYVALLYGMSCWQDLKLHTLRSASTIYNTSAKATELTLAGVRLSMARVEQIQKHKQAADRDQASRRSAYEERAPLRAEKDSGRPMPQYKEAWLARLEETLASPLFPPVPPEDPRKEPLFETGLRLADFLVDYRHHLRLRVLVEIIGPTALAASAILYAFIAKTPIDTAPSPRPAIKCRASAMKPEPPPAPPLQGPAAQGPR